MHVCSALILCPSVAIVCSSGTSLPARSILLHEAMSSVVSTTASEGGFEVLCDCGWFLLHRTVTIYRYENLDIQETSGGRWGTNIMSEMDGSVSWLSNLGVGDWQGSFRHLAFGRIEIRFCCKNGPILKTVDLWKAGNGVWSGYDDRLRRVRLTKLRTLRHCSDCNAWHPVQDILALADGPPV